MDVLTNFKKRLYRDFVASIYKFLLVICILIHRFAKTVAFAQVSNFFIECLKGNMNGEI